MQNENLLTVSVVTYNQEKYIAKCLDSLVSQKADFGYIIRVFDDCSTDDTSKICAEFAQKYPDKVIYIRNKKNIGNIPNARLAHEGISTKYYMYIEGDDYCCEDNKFQMQVNILEKNPQYSFCSHQTLSVNIDDKVLKHKSWKYTFLQEGALKYTDFSTKHSICVNTHISSRIIRTEHIDFENFELYIFDSTQILMLLEKGDMYYIDKAMTVYQQTGDGLYSGADPFFRIDYYMNHLLMYNKHSSGKLKILMYRTIAGYINYILDNLSARSDRSDFLLRVHELKRYYIPRFIWDIIYAPKRWFRKIFMVK
jgi:glycosyltransferase involved in cell wall biosynthesis